MTNINGSAESNGKLKVILLDADLMLRHLFQALVRNWKPDAHLHVFDNGYDAWKGFQSVHPDLVITDDYHEGLHGSVIVTWMAARCTTCPILWTTPDCMQDLPTLFGALKYEVLPRPFQRREFMEKLDRLIAERG